MNNYPNGPQQPYQHVPTIEARCTQGKLVVTPQFVRIEFANLKQQTLSRAALTGIDSKVAIPSVFGLGGGINLVFHGQGGERLHANLVLPKPAKEIMRMLGY